MTPLTATPANLPPDAILFDLMFGAIVERSIYVAAQLGVADEIGDDAKTAAELAGATGTHADSLYRLLRLLASYGCFEESSDQRFRNTPLSDLLRSDSPTSMRDFVLMIANDWNWQTIASLGHSVATGKLAFENAFGMTTWEYFEANPEEGALFNRAMTSVSSGVVGPIADAYDFSQFGKIVDIAGGHGHLLSFVLAANPGVSGVLFDVPSVIAGAGEHFENAGVSDRVGMVAGDFFEAVPKGADAYILKYIIHDWLDPECIRILKNIGDAMNPDGKVLICEMVVPEGNGPSPAKVLDIQMLMAAGGKERTEAEYRQLLDNAGFRLERVIPTASPLQIVEGVKKN
jgi:hypothetical protein